MIPLVFAFAAFLTIKAVSPIARTQPYSASATTFATLPGPTLAARCQGATCSFGGSTETLQANTVTTTILSTTSVPCYITTYVTDSTTTTETIYSTETITSTVTKEGTVYVYQYSPSPYLVSSTYESVLQITQTFTSFWQETSGSAFESKVTGDVKTIGGDTNYGSGGDTSDSSGRGEHDDQGDDKHDTSGKPNGTTVLISTAGPTGDAWTHLAASDKFGVATIGATAAPDSGWATATGTSLNAVGGVAVNWSGADTREKGDLKSMIIVGGTVAAILIFEVWYMMM